jgi:type II secretory pathway component PulC
VYNDNSDILKCRYPTLEHFVESYNSKGTRKKNKPSECCRALTINGVQCSKRISSMVMDECGRKLCYGHNNSYEKNGKLKYGSVDEDELALLDHKHQNESPAPKKVKRVSRNAHIARKTHTTKQTTKDGKQQHNQDVPNTADTSSLSAFIVSTARSQLALNLSDVDDDDF